MKIDVLFQMEAILVLIKNALRSSINFLEAFPGIGLFIVANVLSSIYLEYKFWYYF